MATRTSLHKTRPAAAISITSACVVFWLRFVDVYCYDDLRDTPCLDATAYAALPASRVTWHGTVTVAVECDDGFDFPLNAPGNLTCVPNGSPWKPDYLPDCNEKMIPQLVNATMTIFLSYETCTAIGHPTPTYNVIYFTSGLQIDAEEKCKLYHLPECSVLEVSSECSQVFPFGYNYSDSLFNIEEPPSPDMPSHNDNPSQQSVPHGPKNGAVSYFLLKLTSQFSNYLPWDTFVQNYRGAGLSILRDIDANNVDSNLTVSLNLDCQNSTVAVLKAGVEVVCRGCSLGHYLDKVHKRCLPCEPGFYGDTPLSTICKDCPGVNSSLAEEIWEKIQRVVPNRASDVYGCPVIFKTENGSIDLKMVAKISFDLALIDLSATILQGMPPSNSTFLVLLIATSGLWAFMAGAFFFLLQLQEFRRGDPCLIASIYKGWSYVRGPLAEDTDITY